MRNRLRSFFNFSNRPPALSEAKRSRSESVERLERLERAQAYIVLWLVKYRGATVTAVDDMVRVPAPLFSWYPRHESLLTPAAPSFQSKSSLSAFPLVEVVFSVQKAISKFVNNAF